MSAENVPVTAPLVSIIIPCCGMLEYTKLCVASVRRHSRAPFDLFVHHFGTRTFAHGAPGQAAT